MPNDELLAGASFLDGAVPVVGLRKWNGTGWQVLYTGGGAWTWISEPDKNGEYHIACTFTGGSTFPPVYMKYAIWTGSQFVPGPIGTNTGYDERIYSIVTPGDGLVLAGSFNIASVPGRTLINNTGDANAYPVITITGSGQLLYLINYTTKQIIYFDITLVAGEVLTIDLRPGVKTVISSFGGNRLDGVRAGSLVDWHLAPGNNNVGCYVSGGSGSGAYSFVPTHWSNDGA